MLKKKLWQKAKYLIDLNQSVTTDKKNRKDNL